MFDIYGSGVHRSSGGGGWGGGRKGAKPSLAEKIMRNGGESPCPAEHLNTLKGQFESCPRGEKKEEIKGVIEKLEQRRIYISAARHGATGQTAGLARNYSSWTY